MRVSVGAEITIHDCTSSMFDEVRKLTEFPNPDYYKKQAIGKYVGNVKKTIVLWQKRGRDVIVPFGMLAFIFENRNRFENIENCVQLPDFRLNYESSIIPYEYQEKAILEAIKKRNGVVVAPCGSGKTQVGLEIASRLGLRTLWITHTIDLMNQSIDRAKAVFAMPTSQYGTITGGKVCVGETITFATVQTLANIDLSLYKDYWQVIIVDECHKAVGSPTKMMMFWKVVSSLSARYKFGLTATPKRADGLEPCMFALLGEKVYEITKQDVEQTTCPVKVVAKETEFDANYEEFVGDDGIVDHNKLLELVTLDVERNAIICKDIQSCEKPCMVLTDRVAHAEYLKRMFPDSVLITGNKSKASRIEGMERFKHGKADVMIATYPIAKEGLDVPQLRSLIMATPTKNEVTVVQSCGRVGRKADGKEFGVVYDYVDKCGILKRSFEVRKKIYRREKYLFTFGA